eukprot:PhM_4_TR18220/c0_g1_i1/m.101727
MSHTRPPSATTDTSPNPYEGNAGSHGTVNLDGNWYRASLQKHTNLRSALGRAYVPCRGHAEKYGECVHTVQANTTKSVISKHSCTAEFKELMKCVNDEKKKQRMGIK